MNKFHKNLSVFIIVWTVRDGKIATDLHLVINWKHNRKLTFFCQHSQALYDVMQEDIENLDIVQGLHFEFIDSLKGNDTKYLLIFDDSCGENCNSKLFMMMPLLYNIAG